MSMYGTGIMTGARQGLKLGAKLRDHLPLWMCLSVGTLSLAGLFVLLWLALCLVSQQNHYKRLQYAAHTVFQAEQDYYAAHGKYTANMEELGVTFPGIVQAEYRQGGYVYDNGEKVETPEIYTAQTEKGDSFLVQVMGAADDPAALNLPAALEISVSGKFRSLPASYSIRHFFGKDSPEIPTLFQCNVLILHADTEEQAQSDIRKGGRFCKRLGAQPTHIPLIWLF